jgi:hypothetical protein
MHRTSMTAYWLPLVLPLVALCLAAGGAAAAPLLTRPDQDCIKPAATKARWGGPCDWERSQQLIWPGGGSSIGLGTEVSPGTSRARSFPASRRETHAPHAAASPTQPPPMHPQVNEFNFYPEDFRSTISEPAPVEPGAVVRKKC